MPAATVPETAVDKDGEAGAAENEIGFAGEVLVAPPAGDARSAENGNEPELGVAVAARADRCHHLGALGFCEDVGHCFDDSKCRTRWKWSRKFGSEIMRIGAGGVRRGAVVFTNYEPRWVKGCGMVR